MTELLTKEQLHDLHKLSFDELIGYAAVLDTTVSRFRDIINRYDVTGAAFDNSIRRKKIEQLRSRPESFLYTEIAKIHAGELAMLGKLTIQ